MFRLYLFFSDMRDILSAKHLMMTQFACKLWARKMFRGYDHDEMIRLRDAFLQAAKFVESEMK